MTEQEPRHQRRGRIHVGALIDRSGLALLWCGEAVRSARRRQSRRRRQILRQAEVGEHELLAVGEQTIAGGHGVTPAAEKQVRGREVAMHNSLVMQRGQRIRDRGHDGHHVRRGHGASPAGHQLALRPEVAAGNKLQHVERLVAVGLVEVVQANDVRTVDPTQQPGLGDETLADLRIEAVMITEQLDRHVRAEPFVDRSIDGGKRAGAEQPDDWVAADGRRHVHHGAVVVIFAATKALPRATRVFAVFNGIPARVATSSYGRPSTSRSTTASR